MTGVGRASVRHRGRRRMVLAGWLLGALAVVVRAVMVQLLQGAYWQTAALDQHEQTLEVPATRGSILDRNGNPLAGSNETFRVAVAPRELVPESRDRVVGILSSELGLPRATLASLSDPERKWVELRGWHPPRVRDPLDSIQGVYLTREWRRFYPHRELALGVLGSILDEEGRGGIEGGFNDHLRGTPGREIQARDNVGDPIPGQSVLVKPPVAGGDVVLTLDRDYQEIGHEALAAAMEETGAQGGDLIVSDPATGEILALVSLRADGAVSLSSVNAPYEPGSTLKPFTVAGILQNGVGSLSDTVDGESGRWTVEGRTITDVHKMELMTLAEALKESSNVGVAKAAQGLSPAQQYETLRDFGFGAPTGIQIPGEASGTLRRPSEWSRQSPASLAIGY